jgi:hypothetical protein
MMEDMTTGPPERDQQAFDIDPSAARPARLHNYLRGGDGNFLSDRDGADRVSAALPGGLDTMLANLRAMESFVERAVRYLADDAGIRQFLYIGATVPTTNDVYDVAQRAVPDARVVYVGNDPVVLAHAHVLRGRTPQGATAYVHGTLREPEKILDDAGATLDLTQPVAVMLVVTLSFLPDQRDPYGIVRRLMHGVPSGSHLVIHHATNDIHVEGMADAFKRLDEALREAFVVRSRAEISRFVSGLQLVDPGLVPVTEWRSPEEGPPTGDPDPPIPAFAVVARKP